MCGRPHRLFGLVVPGGRVVAVVAARQLRSPAFRRRSPLRRHWSRLAAARLPTIRLPSISLPIVALLAGFALAGAIGLAWTGPAAAQGFTYNPRPPKPPA